MPDTPAPTKHPWILLALLGTVVAVGYAIVSLYFHAAQGGELPSTAYLIRVGLLHLVLLVFWGWAWRWRHRAEMAGLPAFLVAGVLALSFNQSTQRLRGDHSTAEDTLCVTRDWGDGKGVSCRCQPL